MTSVLMVCTGNICRSPAAEVLLQRALAEAGLAGAVVVDSAGATDWDQGERAHEFSRSAFVRTIHDQQQIGAIEVVIDERSRPIGRVAGRRRGFGSSDGEGGEGAVADEIAFELGERAEELEDELAAGGRGVDVLGE